MMDHHHKRGRTIRVFVNEEERGWLRAMRAAKACAEKTPYATVTAALRTAIEGMESSERKAPLLRHYLCDQCGKYHITSQEPRGSRAKD